MRLNQTLLDPLMGSIDPHYEVGTCRLCHTRKRVCKFLDSSYFIAPKKHVLFLKLFHLIRNNCIWFNIVNLWNLKTLEKFANARTTVQPDAFLALKKCIYVLRNCPTPLNKFLYSIRLSRGGGALVFPPFPPWMTGADSFAQNTMYLLSITLASILIIPLAIKWFCPHLWKDVVYCTELLRILVTFVSRRRRRPLFFVLDRFLEQTAANPRKLFLVFGNERHTYEHADKRSNQIANALRSRPGYQAGDTVALFMGNEPAFIFTWLALAKLGSPVSLLNHNIRSKSLLHCFNCCKANVLIAASGLCTFIRGIERLTDVIHIYISLNTWISY